MQYTVKHAQTPTRPNLCFRVMNFVGVLHFFIIFIVFWRADASSVKQSLGRFLFDRFVLDHGRRAIRSGRSRQQKYSGDEPKLIRIVLRTENNNNDNTYSNTDDDVFDDALNSVLVYHYPIFPAASNILYFHGARENVYNIHGKLRQLASALQANIYAMEYPGYDYYPADNDKQPTKKPTIRSIMRCARRTLEYFTTPQYSPLSLFGSGFGAIIAMKLLATDSNDRSEKIESVVLKNPILPNLLASDAWPPFSWLRKLAWTSLLDSGTLNTNLPSNIRILIWQSKYPRPRHRRIYKRLAKNIGARHLISFDADLQQLAFNQIREFIHAPSSGLQSPGGYGIHATACNSLSSTTDPRSAALSTDEPNQLELTKQPIAAHLSSGLISPSVRQNCNSDEIISRSSLILLDSLMPPASGQQSRDSADRRPAVDHLLENRWFYGKLNSCGDRKRKDRSAIDKLQQSPMPFAKFQ